MDRETDLAKAAAAGDVAAFTALVRLHEGAVRQFLQRLLKGDGADDLAQEVFLKAWRMGAHWRGEGSYKAWLMGIAWSSFLSFRRTEGRRMARDTEAFGTEFRAAPDTDVAIDLSRALATLPDRERAAASLCYGEGYSHAEAARILDLPLGTLKSLVARARTALVAGLETRHD
jgi:RNA polymerase sigma-70 factor (ECF subfamily)